MIESQPEINQYRDLFCARELFIDLLSDKSPFTNLGYSRQQIQYALPSLQLIQGEGEVMTQLKDGPYLTFNVEEGLWEYSTQIYHLPNNQGYFLYAQRNRRIFGGASRGEKIFTFFLAIPPVVIFDEYDSSVAQMALFKKGSPIDNLDYLVRTLFSKHLTEAPLGIRKENILTKLGKESLGLNATYQASWVDERTKLEFVAKIDSPETKGIKPDYVHWRKLLPIKDDHEEMIPWGQKAGSSTGKICAILDEEKEKQVLGNLFWEKQGNGI